MALPTCTKWQCQNTCGPVWVMHMKVIPHYQLMTLILNILGNTLHTGMARDMLVVSKVVVIRFAF